MTKETFLLILLACLTLVGLVSCNGTKEKQALMCNQGYKEVFLCGSSSCQMKCMDERVF